MTRLAASLRKNGFSLNQDTISYFEGKIGLAEIQLCDATGPSNFRMNQNLKSVARLLDWNEIKYVAKYDNYGKLSHVDEIH